MNHVRVLRISFLAISVTFALNSFATDWLQFGYDQAHSSNNTAEPGYATATGNKLVPAFASGVSLAHQADSAPIFVGGVTTASGVKDVLFINSLDGTLVALDAKNGSLIWSKQPTPAGGTNGTLAQGGITGSPAVD
jgi:outer membrane protein assembly factor BamB